MDCSVGCSEIPKKDTSKTAPLDVKKVWSYEEAYFWGLFFYLFNSLQLILIDITNGIHKDHYK